MEKIYDLVLSDLPDIPVRKNVPLKELTSFRIGGPARVVMFPETEAQLAKAMRSIEKNALPFRVLGNGSNVLAPDSGFDGIILCLNRPFTALSVSGTTVRCPAGLALSSCSHRTVEMGLSGMEGLEGIPGTVGGACAMNAGAYGYEIKQILKRARVYRNGEISDITITDKDLGYRTSTLSAPGTILISAEFVLGEDDGHTAERVADFRARRIEKQPLEYPSAGSVFKRPVGFFAGSLIEQCGLKGYSVGGAMVSEKHAGFIINKGGATEHDVRKLIRYVQKTVFEQTGVSLERELKFWDEEGR